MKSIIGEDFFANSGANRVDLKFIIVAIMVVTILCEILQYLMFKEATVTIGPFKGTFSQGVDGWRIPMEMLFGSLYGVTLLYCSGQVIKAGVGTLTMEVGDSMKVPIHHRKTIFTLIICWLVLFSLAIVLQIVSGATVGLFGVDIIVKGFVTATIGYVGSIVGHKMTEMLSLTGIVAKVVDKKEQTAVFKVKEGVIDNKSVDSSEEKITQ